VTVVLIYLAYTLCTASALVARRGGWPSQPAAFSLGRAGLAINAAAVLWGVAMIINLAWYRPTDGAPWYLNLATLVFVPVIILVGLIYYYGWQKRRPSTQPEM
jgi:cytochrome c biogenesis factor